MATAAEIIAAAATAAAEGVASATVDGNTAVQIDPLKQIQAADAIASRAAVGGVNAQGGSRSGWNTLRRSRVIPPGAV